MKNALPKLLLMALMISATAQGQESLSKSELLNLTVEEVQVEEVKRDSAELSNEQQSIIEKRKKALREKLEELDVVDKIQPVVLKGTDKRAITEDMKEVIIVDKNGKKQIVEKSRRTLRPANAKFVIFKDGDNFVKYEIDKGYLHEYKDGKGTDYDEDTSDYKFSVFTDSDTIAKDFYKTIGKNINKLKVESIETNKYTAKSEVNVPGDDKFRAKAIDNTIWKDLAQDVECWKYNEDGEVEQVISGATTARVITCKRPLTVKEIDEIVEDKYRKDLFLTRDIVSKIVRDVENGTDFVGLVVKKSLDDNRSKLGQKTKEIKIERTVETPKKATVKKAKVTVNANKAFDDFNKSLAE